MKGDWPLERKAALVGGLGSLATQYAKAMGLRTFAVDSGAERVNVAKHLGADTCIDYIQSKDLVYDVKAAPPDGLGSHPELIITANEAVHWWNSIEQGLSKLRHGSSACKLSNVSDLMSSRDIMNHTLSILLNATKASPAIEKRSYAH